ncbi:hypothetical protein HID58_066903 [Brassica napus]|uniref:Uncharacterized protein n=1 Tax=Brassica napus TaxID=3708 RepID=A0ABQ7ZGZ5_BRANA|nr:hypothetical protein HID58_066903 [Brassica napus]
MLLKGDSRRGPGTCRDPELIHVSNCAIAGSMVAHSLREVLWGPTCASFRFDESKSFLAPSAKLLGDFNVQAIRAQFYGMIGGKRLVFVVLSPA